MNTATSLGVMPKLLPITGTYLLPLTLLNTVLSLNTVRARLSTNTLHGSTTASSPSSPPQNLSTDDVHLSTRAHANFLENVPFALILAAVVELNGGDKKVLNWVLGAFTVARVSHAVGITGLVGIWGRAGGYYVSVGVLTGLGGWGAWLLYV